MISMTVSIRLKERLELNPKNIIQIFKEENKNYIHLSCEEMKKITDELSNCLLSLGVKRQEKVGLISDNRKEWLWYNLSIINVNAIDVPRGTDTQDLELEYILFTVEAKKIVVENKEIKNRILSLKDKFPLLDTILIMDEKLTQEEAEAGDTKGVNIISFEKARKLGREYQNQHPNELEELIYSSSKDDICTIIFTSGTTGKPKGVMITHANFLYFDLSLRTSVDSDYEKWFSTLPVWHSFERCIEYVSVIFQKGTIVYSKPIGKTFLEDLENTGPHWIAVVPRMLEALSNSIKTKIEKRGKLVNGLFNFFYGIGKMYHDARLKILDRYIWIKKRNRFADVFLSLFVFIALYIPNRIGRLIFFDKVKAIFGKNFKSFISGGASLSMDVSDFFAIMNLNLIEGYGLTEASPIITIGNEHTHIPGTVGKIMLDGKAKILDTETGEELGEGKVGELWFKGPQVSLGYYKDEENTKKTFSDGWLNTGDLAMITLRHHCLKIVGRSKDTIVLSGGENVEPTPVELKLNASPYIDRSMLVGQDRKQLGVLILPNKDRILEYAKSNNIPGTFDDLIENTLILNLIKEEVKNIVSIKNGFRAFEQIYPVKLLKEPFTVEQELSAKQDLKRNFIYKKYESLINEMYK